VVKLIFLLSLALAPLASLAAFLITHAENAKHLIVPGRGL